MTGPRKALTLVLGALTVVGGLAATQPGLLPVAARQTATSPAVSGGGPCTLDALDVSYRTEFRDGGYVVTHADVGRLPAECTGANLRVLFHAGTGSSPVASEEFLVLGKGTTATAFVQPVPVRPVTRVEVQLRGRKVAYPDECAHVVAGVQRVITGTTGDDASVYANDRENALVLGLTGNDRLFGRDGTDCVVGGSGDDVVSGGDKTTNVVLGGAGNDTVHAGNGDDRLYGGDGKDRLQGNDGNDLLYAGAGADTLYGGNGNDTLYAGKDFVLVDGGAGKDVCWVPASRTGKILDCETVKTYDAP